MLEEEYYDTLGIISVIRKEEKLTNEQNQILKTACREINSLTASILKELENEGEAPISLYVFIPEILKNYSFILKKYIEISGGSV